jgi:hypothetical protein
MKNIDISYIKNIKIGVGELKGGREGGGCGVGWGSQEGLHLHDR